MAMKTFTFKNLAVLMLFAMFNISSCLFFHGGLVRQRCFRQLTRFATHSSSDTSTRKDLLSKTLRSLDIDADGLEEASVSSMRDPSLGYDGRYGKSAIRTYRSFLYPKKSTEQDYVRLEGEAERCARQIDFLLKRHKSHVEEWVRHHDGVQESERTIFPLIVVLDNVRSAFNVGSIFRTADAAGCQQVVTTGITPHPFGSGAEKLAKSALGAEILVPSRHFATTREAVTSLREDYPHYDFIGMETTDQSVVFTKHEYPRDGVVLVLGNEVTGVDTDVMKNLDKLVEIPMYGSKNSLNIAACAPVVLYEIVRQWTN